ncbi:HAD-IA family hydrolase [Paenibacillus hodogayensis]|uniref:HAD-IA family hydrolase n=1 Tax=Paenibacillus hodogayensis TaxID=279208 RepID=A0ABV5VUQ3_9BACL
MSISLHGVKAVLFDVGDTLLTIPGSRTILQRYLAERELHREQEHIGHHFDDAFRKLYYEKPADGTELCSPESDRSFWASLYVHVLYGLGIHEDREEEVIHRWSHELYDLFTAPEQYELFDDVKESLERLKLAGYRLGVVSNFAPTLKSILRHKGILDYFDPVIVSTEVGLEKPNPAIFRLALEQAGLSPEETLYVGDHDKNDIWAPNQAGIRAVKIKRYPHMTGEGIFSLRELG